LHAPALERADTVVVTACQAEQSRIIEESAPLVSQKSYVPEEEKHSANSSPKIIG
jgi:hypothetical protein